MHEYVHWFMELRLWNETGHLKPTSWRPAQDRTEDRTGDLRPAYGRSGAPKEETAETEEAAGSPRERGEAAAQPDNEPSARRAPGSDVAAGQLTRGITRTTNELRCRPGKRSALNKSDK